jgi:hypothetical protein
VSKRASGIKAREPVYGCEPHDAEEAGNAAGDRAIPTDIVVIENFKEHAC